MISLIGAGARLDDGDDQQGKRHEHQADQEPQVRVAIFSLGDGGRRNGENKGEQKEFHGCLSLGAATPRPPELRLFTQYRGVDVEIVDLEGMTPVDQSDGDDGIAFFIFGIDFIGDDLLFDSRTRNYRFACKIGLLKFLEVAEPRKRFHDLAHPFLGSSFQGFRWHVFLNDFRIPFRYLGDHLFQIGYGRPSILGRFVIHVNLDSCNDGKSQNQNGEYSPE